jgi:hypothetical protein
MRISMETLERRRAVPRILGRLLFVVLVFAAALSLWLAPRAAPDAGARAAVEWPVELDGRPLRPLALGSVERRFADRFPGAIARLTDGERVLILRRVDEPTRMLHPATDCYRGLGYAIRDERLERMHAGRIGTIEGSGPRTSSPPSTALADAHDREAGVQRCFVAARDGMRLRVCERIEDADGRVYADTSAWYWAALTGRSAGPWIATTIAERT